VKIKLFCVCIYSTKLEVVDNDPMETTSVLDVKCQSIHPIPSNRTVEILALNKSQAASIKSVIVQAAPNGVRTKEYVTRSRYRVVFLFPPSPNPIQMTTEIGISKQENPRSRLKSCSVIIHSDRGRM
jgi:hypothetical protein